MYGHMSSTSVLRWQTSELMLLLTVRAVHLGCRAVAESVQTGKYFAACRSIMDIL